MTARALSAIGIVFLLAQPAAAQPAAPTPPASPHAAVAPSPHAQPLANSEDESADVPPGTIEVTLVDGDERPLPGADLRLGILFQKIAEGESRTSKTGRTGPDGTARFAGLTTGSNYAYRVTARSGPAEFASSPFNLREVGVKVRLHVYAVTSNPTEAVVGMRGFLHIDTRDDVFQAEVLFRVINLGKKAWVPSDVLMTLPEDFKAFSAGEAMADTRFELVEGRGARLVGTFTPGQHDVSFRFQVPKTSEDTATFQVRPPARTAEMRVLATTNKTLGLEVDGFERPQEAVGPNGQPVLVTRKLVGRGEPEVGAFTVVLTGLPVPGMGRWVVVVIALGFGALGALGALGKLKLVSTERLVSDRARARELLFSELVTLARAKDHGEVGPGAYDRAHRALVDALARIGLPSQKKPRKRLRSAEALTSSTPSG